MTTYFHTTYLEDNTEILIEYEQEPYIPAKLFGPPEDCYPAEGGGVTIIDINQKRDGEWIDYAASEEEIDGWTAEIETLPIEPDEPDADYLYDKMRDDRMMGYED